MTGSAVLRGVIVPLVILVLAFATFYFAPQTGSLGQLDSSTYRWVSIGLWIAAPVVGGLASRPLTDRQTTIAAAVIGVVLGIAVAAEFLTGAGTASLCGNGSGRSAAAYVAGCLGVGGIVGIGAGVSEFITAWLARRGRWLLSVVLGGGLSFAAGAGAYLLYYSIVTCMRP